MNEHIWCTITGFFQPCPQPAGAPFTEFSPMGTLPGIFEDAIEQDERPGGGLQDRLNKPVFVTDGVRERPLENLPIVVIPDEQMIGHAQCRETIPKVLVGLGQSIMGKITGNHAKLRIIVMGVDMGDASIKAGARIKPMQGFARGHEMGVGNLDEFHA